MASSRLVPVGRIVKTHGLRGALKMVPYGETLQQLEPKAKLHLVADGDTGEATLTLMQLRRQGRHWVAHFSELAGVDAAQKIVGKEVFLPEEELPPTSEGEYYHFQLIGLRVETAGDGRVVGVLRAVIETGSNDVYVVEHDDREVLIPAIAEVILEIDLQDGRMIIAAPEGLLDDL